MRGLVLTLGTVAGLAAAAHLRRRGSRQDHSLSETQTQLLRVKNTYKAKPELCIRALDLIVTQLPGAGNIRNTALPGTHHTTEILQEVVRELRPNGTLTDYLDILAQQIREDRHYAASREGNFSLRTPWNRARYIPWIAREVVRAIEATRATKTPSGRARKANEATQHKKMTEVLTSMRSELSNVLDWIVSTRADVSGLTYAQAKTASDAWHQAMRQQATAQRARQQAELHKYKLLPGHRASLKGEVLYTFDDGWTVQRLTKRNQLHEEAKAILHHCAADGGYWDQLEHGQMLSLRDPENRPWQTITMEADGVVLRNAQGRYDRLLGHDKALYGGGGGSALDHVKDDLPAGMSIEEFLAFECKKMIEFLEHVSGGHAHLGRHEDCRGIVAAWEEKQRQKKAKAKGRKEGSEARRWR